MPVNKEMGCTLSIPPFIRRDSTLPGEVQRWGTRESTWQVFPLLLVSPFVVPLSVSSPLPPFTPPRVQYLLSPILILVSGVFYLNPKRIPFGCGFLFDIENRPTQHPGCTLVHWGVPHQACSWWPPPQKTKIIVCTSRPECCSIGPLPPLETVFSASGVFSL